MSEKGTFLKVTKQLSTFKNMHDLSEMILVLLLILLVNQNIIEETATNLPMYGLNT